MSLLQESSPTRQDLDETIINHREQLRRYPNFAHLLCNLAEALLSRFLQSSRTEDLEEGIAHSYHALALSPPGHPYRSLSLADLADALLIRFGRLRRMEDLEEGIAHSYHALALSPPGHPRRSHSLMDLANALFTRFKRLSTMEDLEDAIIYNRQVLALLPPGHPNHSIVLNNLATVVSTRFIQLGSMEDLEEAIKCYRQVLILHPPSHLYHSSSLNNLATALSTRFQQRGKIEDLEEAITFFRQALSQPAGGKGSSISNNLASAIFLRFKQRGSREDLKEAAKYHHRALRLCPPSHPDRPRYLNSLANVYSTRFEQLGKMEDLEVAVKYHREALALCPPGCSGRSFSLDNTGMALLTLFKQNGKMEVLEEAITYHRQALALHSPTSTSPAYSASLTHIAEAISARFEYLGRMEDLEEAILYHSRALTLRPPGHPSRSISLNNLAIALRARFKQLGKLENLDDAIMYHRQALNMYPQGHPDRSLSLSNLGNAISDRFERLGRIQDIEESIVYHREALQLCPLGHPYRSASLNNLAISTHLRFLLLGRTSDLEEAIACFSAAGAALPTDHPKYAMVKSHLASTYLARHDSYSPADDSLPMVFGLYEVAAHQSNASSLARFEVAMRWARRAWGHQHESTVTAYSIALNLLHHCLVATPTVESRQKFLAENSAVPRSLASDAAASAIAAGRLETAVELLEQGRAILWSQMRGYRHPLEELRDVDRELADQFETLSSELESHAMSSESRSMASPGPGPLGFIDATMRKHRLLVEDRDKLLERIRKIDGFSDFLKPVPFNTLRMAAVKGPVIIVNVSDYRSDAIILHGMTSPVLVPLPEATPERLVKLSSQLFDARASRPRQRIFPILRSLWTMIVRPVKDRLTMLGVAKFSRIWWCPTSELCALPLHAAGAYRVREDNNLPDIFISSYTPTLSALIRARSNLADRPAVPNLLVMGQLDETLPEVGEEIRRIQKLANNANVLVGESANSFTVLSGLQQHSWAHFACHGHFNVQPFHSSFQLHDNESLTLVDLMKARLPNAELAFLSACHSAAGDTEGAPDEVIHLAAALQFGGFRSVVGTLWEMADIDGPDVAEDFYKYMFRQSGGVADFRDAARALNMATQAMRNRKGMTVDRWINFVHIGA